MEIVQILLVAASGIFSIRFLYKKFLAPKKDKDCGTDCGCH
tara:strand:+ start:5770 stop:5892 length:123 start_codon:yes stop_codon:yes gene_type:complete